MIKCVNLDVYGKISKLLFHKKFGSLEYSSPFILEELLECIQDVQGLNYGQPQMQHIAKKVKALMDGQAETLKSSRISTYNKLLRWMPFQTPIYFQSL